MDDNVSPEQLPTSPRRRQTWLQRFSVAARGIKIAVRAEANFFVHLFATVVVVLAAWTIGISQLEWCLLILCIGIVLAAELFNTALERLAQAITQAENSHIRDALDIASGAVLTTALAAATLGTIIFGWHLFN